MVPKKVTQTDDLCKRSRFAITPATATHLRAAMRWIPRAPMNTFF